MPSRLTEYETQSRNDFQRFLSLLPIAQLYSPVIERLMVQGLQVALKHVIHDMEARTLVMKLRRRAIKRWVPCGDMDRRLKIPHSAKAECGFGTTPK